MTFGRIMFWSLVPGLALLVGVLTLMQFIPDCKLDSLSKAVASTFGFVLLGSMTLNAWLVLRHQRSYATRALAQHLASVHAALYLCIVVWLVTLSLQGSTASALVSWAQILVAVALMALSIASFVLVMDRPAEFAFRAEEPTPRTRALQYWASAFVVLALAASASYVVLRRDESEALWTFPLLLLGLPWSHPFYAVLFVPFARLTNFSVLTASLLVPIAVNVGLALALLLSQRFRTRATKWFFRLNPHTQRTSDEEAEDA